MTQRSLTKICEKLIDGALMEAGRTNHGHDFKRKIELGQYNDLPDWYKLGGMIRNMNPEDREVLKEAKEKDFNGRLFS